MQKILHILIILVLITNPLFISNLLFITVPLTYAQDDSDNDNGGNDGGGGDGVSGAGSDNTDYSDNSNNSEGESDVGSDNEGSSEGDSDSGESNVESEGGSSESGAESEGEQITQDEVDQAREDQSEAWENYQNMITSDLASSQDIEDALQSYLAESAYADNVSEQFAAQTQEAAEYADQQQNMQDTITSEGLDNIANGETNLESIANQHLDPSLSPDRAAAVMGEWAEALGISPEDIASSAELQTAWNNFVNLSVSAGTIPSDQAASALAGGLGIVTQTTGGSLEQMAEAAASSGGFSAYVATLNSTPAASQEEKEDRARAVAAFGVSNGISTQDIGAAISSIGISDVEKAKDIALSAYQSREGFEGDRSTIGSLIQSGYQYGPTAAASSLGVPSGIPSVAPPAGLAAADPANQKENDFRSFADNRASTVSSSSSPAEKEAAVRDIIENAITNGVQTDVLGQQLRSIGLASPRGTYESVLQSLGVQNANQVAGNINFFREENVQTRTPAVPITITSTSISPASGPGPATVQTVPSTSSIVNQPPSTGPWAGQHYTAPPQGGGVGGSAIYTIGNVGTDGRFDAGQVSYEFTHSNGSSTKVDVSLIGAPTNVVNDLPQIPNQQEFNNWANKHFVTTDNGRNYSYQSP